MNQDLADLCVTVVDRLAETRCRVVFAESCTCGMVACELGKISGVSEWLCGSAVTYRSDTKVRWIGVDGGEIERHTAVSDPVARQMASGVLERTPEADIAISITGHLGPNAPDGFDGLIHIGLAERIQEQGIRCGARSSYLESVGRLPRQIEATRSVLDCLMEALVSRRC